jgi:hypothetical protein
MFHFFRGEIREKLERQGWISLQTLVDSARTENLVENFDFPQIRSRSSDVMQGPML